MAFVSKRYAVFIYLFSLFLVEATLADPVGPVYVTCGRNVWYHESDPYSSYGEMPSLQNADSAWHAGLYFLSSGDFGTGGIPASRHGSWSWAFQAKTNDPTDIERTEKLAAYIRAQERHPGRPFEVVEATGLLFRDIITFRGRGYSSLDFLTKTYFVKDIHALRERYTTYRTWFSESDPTSFQTELLGRIRFDENYMNEFDLLGNFLGHMSKHSAKVEIRPYLLGAVRPSGGSAQGVMVCNGSFYLSQIDLLPLKRDCSVYPGPGTCGP